jgi:hypothetical protein
MEHIRDPDAAERVAILSLNADRVALVAERGKLGRVVDLHDRVSGRVDISELVLLAFARGDVTKVSLSAFGLAEYDTVSLLDIAL